MHSNGIDMQQQYKGQQAMPPPPQTVSPLQEVQHRQERVVETLHERIAQLESRLEGVLVPTGPTAPGHAGGINTPGPIMSQHHMRGSALVDRIEQAIGRIEDVLQRLQV